MSHLGQQVVLVEVVVRSLGRFASTLQQSLKTGGICGSAPTYQTLLLLLLQVELLLTLEEFCGEEGVFEQPEADNSNSSTAAGGAAFAPLFANLLQLLYDGEIVEEAAVTSWAAEKEHADESEKLFLQKVSSGAAAEETRRGKAPVAQAFLPQQVTTQDCCTGVPAQTMPDAYGLCDTWNAQCPTH